MKTGLKDINVSDVGKYMVMSKMRKSNLNGTENAQVCIAHNGQMEKALNSSQYLFDIENRKVGKK